MVPMQDVISTGFSAVQEMRATRRKHRVQETEWFEALYRVYLAAMVVGGSVLFLSGLIEDTPATAADLTNITRHGPHILGIIVATALFIGVRSGNNGGPIAVEEAEVRHVLTAPIPLANVLRKPAFQRLRTAAFAGAVAGAVSGQLAARRLPGSLGEWALYGAIYGMCVGLILVGAALLSHGLRFPRLLSTLGVSALLAWQVAAAIQGTSFPGPFDSFGSMALWPLHVEAIDLISVILTVGISASGLLVLGTLSLEALSRRSSLVSQLRFAVTLQDIRTVVLLRRQLSQEQMRARPWITLRRSAKTPPVQRRGIQSLLKFPARRLARMKLLIVLAAMCQVWAYRGTTPAVVASGLCLFVFGLEIIEPLSQEVDKPDRTDSLPVDRGELLLRHLLVPAIALVPFALLAIVTVFIFEPSAIALATAAVLALPALATGTAGAIINAVKGAPDPLGDSSKAMFMPPEVAGMTTMTRAVWPVIVAISGSLPVLAVRDAVDHGNHPVAAAVRVSVGVALLLFLVAGWVRQRDAIRRWWKQNVDASMQQKKEVSS